MARFLEVTLYQLLVFVPQLVLVLYPFNKKYRFSLKTSSILFVSFIIVHLCIGNLGILVFPKHKQIFNLVNIVIYAAYMAFTIKARVGKLAFMFMVTANINSWLNITAKYLEFILFPENTEAEYRWSFSLMLIMVQLVMIPIIFYAIKSRFTAAIEKETQLFAWKYLWLIPSTFYFIWRFHVYYHHESVMDFAKDLNHIIFVFIVNCGAFLAYITVLRLILEQHENISLKEHNAMLNMQTLQYGSLHNRIEEARHARHDMRHHISVMQGYVEKGEYDKLREYLSEYTSSLHDDGAIQYCQNSSINLLLLYFASIARQGGVEYEVRTDIPDSFFINDYELTVLMGNLVENAVQAAVGQKTGKRRVEICAHSDENNMYITIDNTFDNEIRRNKSGVLMSTKHRGAGLGVESAKSIVEEYDGVFLQEIKNGVYCTSVMLKRK